MTAIGRPTDTTKIEARALENPLPEGQTLALPPELATRVVGFMPRFADWFAFAQTSKDNCAIAEQTFLEQAGRLGMRAQLLVHPTLPIMTQMSGCLQRLQSVYERIMAGTFSPTSFTDQIQTIQKEYPVLSRKNLMTFVPKAWDFRDALSLLIAGISVDQGVLNGNICSSIWNTPPAAGQLYVPLLIPFINRPNRFCLNAILDYVDNEQKKTELLNGVFSKNMRPETFILDILEDDDSPMKYVPIIVPFLSTDAKFDIRLCRLRPHSLNAIEKFLLPYLPAETFPRLVAHNQKLQGQKGI